MDLEGLIEEMSEDETLVIGGDLNGHMGMESNDYDRVHGDHGHGLRNEGVKILDISFLSIDRKSVV